MKKYAGEIFLNRLYKDLVHSDEVRHTAKGANKNEDLAIYLERLERISNEARDKKRIDLLKYFYYKKYIIKEENIPESYFENQKKIALERGYGHIKYDDKTKKREIDSIISEQKESLDIWMDYFISKETNHYPMWFKYYVFQNIIKIGYFDKLKNEFTKRTSSTVKPFIEINREAIAMLYDELYKYLGKQELTDEQLEQLIKNGNFNKIYSYIIRKLDEVKKINSTSNDGIWKKYEQGSDPNLLFNDIHGKGTGWCTAGGINTASSHLEGGDFHVYYTKDENGDYTNPRIAIRMEYNKIGEIRGIAEQQNLESEMECVVEEKLREFPDKDEYKKKVSDMKLLTMIYNKNGSKEELTKEELRFLYEIDSKIIGFGFKEDPRIEEIKKERHLKKDLAFIFDVKEEEVSLMEEDFLGGITKVHYGELNLDYITSIEDLKLPIYFIGVLYLSGLTSGEGLVLPEKMNASLGLCGLINAEGLVLPQEMNGDLDLSGLTSAKGLVLPEIINGILDLDGLTSGEGLLLPQKINGKLDLRNLTSAEGLVFPEKINGSLILSGLTSAKGLVFPQEINGFLNLSGLTSVEGLVLPQEINGSLNLSGLTSAEGLVLPQEINGSLNLSGLTSAEGLVLPQKINGSLNLSGLTSAKDLVFPEEINGDLDLENLTSAEGLVLPKKIRGNLPLCSLESLEGLVLPKNSRGEFYVPGDSRFHSFGDIELIEAAKRTETRQQEPKIFDDIDDLSTGNPKK